MKNEVSYVMSCKSVRMFAPSLSALLLLGGIGCEGGMIGTGSGPGDLAYEFKNLPSRISPDIPITLRSNEEPNPNPPNSSDISSYNDENEFSVSLRNIDFPDQSLSSGWSELNLRIAVVDIIRLGIEINSSIVDLAFDDILIECAEQLLDCTIPADQIRVTITQDVVNHLIKSNVESDEIFNDAFGNEFDIGDNPENSYEVLNAYFESLLNKEVVLGETHYSQLDGTPYDHAISTVLKRGTGIEDFSEFEYGDFEFWRDEIFTVRWHEDKNVAKYTGGHSEESTYEYFYQNNVPSELVTINIETIDDEGFVYGTSVTILGSDPNQAGVLVDSVTSGPGFEFFTPNSEGLSDGLGIITTSVDDSSETVTELVTDNGATTTAPDEMPIVIDEVDSDPVDEFLIEITARVFQAVQGQIDNNGGYSSFDQHHFDLTEDQNRIFHVRSRESFEPLGALIAGERCFFDVSDRTNAECSENMFESFGPDGSSLTDSVHYFSPDEFDSLASIQDSIRWKVEGLPSDIESIAVVSSDTQNVLSARELLCRGVPYIPDDVHIFCTATDQQLDSTVVVELVDGVPTQVIPNANLVQIQ